MKDAPLYPRQGSSEIRPQSSGKDMWDQQQQRESNQQPPVSGHQITGPEGDYVGPNDTERRSTPVRPIEASKKVQSPTRTRRYTAIRPLLPQKFPSGSQLSICQTPLPPSLHPSIPPSLPRSILLQPIKSYHEANCLFDRLSVDQELEAFSPLSEEEGGRDEGPGTGVGRAAGARPVGTVVLVVLGGAVVEQAFDAAQAGAVLHGAFGGAQAALSARPAGRQPAGGAALLALTSTAPLADEQVEARLRLVLRQALAKGSVRLEFSFRLRTDHRGEAGMRRRQTRQEPLVRRGAVPGHGRASGTGAAQVGQLGVLLLALAAGQGRVERRRRVVGVHSVRVTVVMGVEKAGLGRRFQRHGPVHIVIVGPDGTYLVERQHGDLLEVQPVQLHPEGMSRVHPAPASSVLLAVRVNANSEGFHGGNPPAAPGSSPSGAAAEPQRNGTGTGLILKDVFERIRRPGSGRQGCILKISPGRKERVPATNSIRRRGGRGSRVLRRYGGGGVDEGGGVDGGVSC
ncbi:hypothetical protein EYF80_053174 [Liparis tanakae]|uniref:Uncharacterized protein n=1 Tax=Liparis tanakae TaxID=230148 RepID=A0A4Z2F656_9TELE|nr:hypothetical protein EYF80_053174 [Liparis tanakae]